MKVHSAIIIVVLVPFLACCKTKPADKDVLKVMSYNVLKYGDGCQGPNSQMHGYLKTIIKYTNPDILGLVKVEAIPQTSADKGNAPIGFADSIVANALNAAYTDKYIYAPYSNKAQDNNQAILFYNKHKLGFASMVTLASDITDFNMYKLFYLDPNLGKTQDTAFLYVILNHTQSGDESTDRDRQMAEIVTSLKKQFTALPNVIDMGDFNLRNTDEPGYQTLTKNSDKNFCFADAPFAVDKVNTYPADWDNHPKKFSIFLTTSTRRKKKDPNDCGTGGGAKSWYDHILLSHALIENTNFYHYVSNSYHTIGNDGNRIDASVNDMPNNDAPAEVLNALFEMSNKYPVMLEIGINPKKK